MKSGKIEKPGRQSGSGPVSERLYIKECEASRHEDICRLLAASFRGKFGRPEARDDDITARLLAAAWPYRKETNQLQLAAAAARSDASGSGPLGTILLKWRPAGASVERESRAEPSLIALMIEFGPLRTLRLLIGMAALHYTPAAEECYIEHLAVRSDCRGQGIGRKLMLHAQEYAEQRGFRTCSLHVSKHNPAAIALYESLGFVKLRTERRWLSRRLFGEGDWIWMRKEMS